MSNNRKEAKMTQSTKTPVVTVSNSRTLADVLESSNGSMVSVTFQKKDGSIRVLNGRMGVTSHLKGGKKTVDENKYVTIFDTQNGGYRSVNRDTIITLKSKGVVFTRSIA